MPRCNLFLLVFVFVFINLFLVMKTPTFSSLQSIGTRIGNQEPCNLDYINLKRLEQDHPCVIDIIRRDYLRIPSPRQVPYNLSKPEVRDPSAGQSQLVLSRLNNLTSGFFVECGAHDGEFLSNTLYMERYLNWSGILIEPMKNRYSKLVSRNRKSHTIPVCLSLEPYPTEVAFNGTRDSGGKVIEDPHFDTRNPRHYKMQCFPLYSILLAAGRTLIDFLSLDVEGHELNILKTIPWKKVNIKTLTVEWNHIPEGDLGLTSFMEANGYVKTDDARFSWGHDLIFVKKSIFYNLLDS